MIPVKQTILSADEGGNCFAACLASILELPVRVVPNAAAEWIKGDSDEHLNAGWALIRSWLYGLGLDVQCFDESWRPSGYWIAIVDSPRFPGKTHAVVFEGESFVWDPHPEAPGDGSDLGEPTSVYVLIARDPAMLARELPAAA